MSWQEHVLLRNPLAAGSRNLISTAEAEGGLPRKAVGGVRLRPRGRPSVPSKGRGGADSGAHQPPGPRGFPQVLGSSRSPPRFSPRPLALSRCLSVISGVGAVDTAVRLVCPRPLCRHPGPAVCGLLTGPLCSVCCCCVGGSASVFVRDTGLSFPFF